MIERAAKEDLGSFPFEVIDSLVSTEVAAPALALYRATTANRRSSPSSTSAATSTIAAVLGIATRAYVAAGQVSVLASEGFIEHAL